jgi:ribosomal protein L22
MLTLSAPLYNYFPRARWYPWRQRLVRARNKQTILNKTVTPYPGFQSCKDRSSSFSFTAQTVALSLKKLQRYSELLRHKHLQDAIDWLEAITRPSSRPLIKLLQRTQKTLVDERGFDPARLFVNVAVGERGRYERRVNFTRDGGTKIRRHAVNKFKVSVSEMDMNKFFHRVYVEKRVPRCIVIDMQSAVRDGRAEGKTAVGFLPYLTSETRRMHRKRVKLLSLQRDWDYKVERKKWIEKYQTNSRKWESSLRIGRGLLGKLEEVQGFPEPPKAVRKFLAKCIC